MKKIMLTVAVLLCFNTYAYGGITKADCDTMFDKNIDLIIQIGFDKPQDKESLTNHDIAAWNALRVRVTNDFNNMLLNAAVRDEYYRLIDLNLHRFEQIDHMIKSVDDIKDKGDILSASGLTEYNIPDYTNCHLKYSQAHGRYLSASAITSSGAMEVIALTIDMMYGMIDLELDSYEMPQP